MMQRGRSHGMNNPDFVCTTLRGGYVACSRSSLSENQRAQLGAILEARPDKPQHLLRGRGNVLHTEIDGMGKVVVKRYMRGGVLRYLVRKTYLRVGPTRAEKEFLILEQVRSLGVHAPEPLMYISRGRLWYDAWLVTREIESPINFAELSVRSESEVFRYTDEIVRQISILIRNNIFHVDLHPGNVVLDHTGKVYLIDFDKARVFGGPRNALRDAYLVRWRRAVIKHRLPEALSESICPGLRTNYED
ncbi:MAG: hypothetical protein EBZ48_12055 [Proteobacteria bacterium]|nr:hypothetical protein [Pseudomonadota bacterium]